MWSIVIVHGTEVLGGSIIYHWEEHSQLAATSNKSATITDMSKYLCALWTYEKEDPKTFFSRIKEPFFNDMVCCTVTMAVQGWQKDMSTK